MKYYLLKEYAYTCIFKIDGSDTKMRYIHTIDKSIDLNKWYKCHWDQSEIIYRYGVEISKEEALLALL